MSLNISVNYLRPGKGGSTVKIVGEVVKIGRTVCSIEVTITEKDSGRLIAKGTHVKVRLPLILDCSVCSIGEQSRRPLDQTQTLCLLVRKMKEANPLLWKGVRISVYFTSEP